MILSDCLTQLAQPQDLIISYCNSVIRTIIDVILLVSSLFAVCRQRMLIIIRFTIAGRKCCNDEHFGF